MSWADCKDCGRFVNTDDDPDAFVEVGNVRRMNWTVIVCEKCRDERDADAEYLADMASKHETEAENRSAISKQNITGVNETTGALE